jgi:hypothetical protein
MVQTGFPFPFPFAFRSRPVFVPGADRHAGSVPSEVPVAALRSGIRPGTPWSGHETGNLWAIPGTVRATAHGRAQE